MTVLAGGLTPRTHLQSSPWTLSLPQQRATLARVTSAIADQALTFAFDSAVCIPFDDAARYVFLSDCHRGDGGYADEFARNKDIYLDALWHYAADGFTYVELGDGDELWKNRHFDDVRRAHRDTYDLLQSLHTAGRFQMVWGNHDMFWQERHNVREHLQRYFDAVSRTYSDFFSGIQVHQALLFQHVSHGFRLFATHGHQVDLISHQLAGVGQFAVGRLWKYMQWLGLKDPTSPAENAPPETGLERALVGWVQRHRQPLICGHTHRPHFPGPDEEPYFNSGSCVHPRSITAIELQAGTLSLVRWQADAPSGGRRLERAHRTLMAAPAPLSAWGGWPAA